MSMYLAFLVKQFSFSSIKKAKTIFKSCQPGEQSENRNNTQIAK